MILSTTTSSWSTSKLQQVMPPLAVDSHNLLDQGPASICKWLEQVATAEELLSFLQNWNTSLPPLHRVRPTEAIVLQTLVENVIPRFWSQESPPELTAVLLQTLSCMGGVNALLRHLRTEVEAKLLQYVLDSPTFTLKIIHAFWFEGNVLKQETAKQLWASYLSLITGSKLINSVATHNETLPLHLYSFTSAEWLTGYVTRSILALCQSYTSKSAELHEAEIAQLLSGAISLGNAEVICYESIEFLSRDEHERTCALFGKVISSMGMPARNRLILASCAYLEKKYFAQATSSAAVINDDDRIGAAASLLNIFSGNEMDSPAQRWLIHHSHRASLALRRAALLAVQTSDGLLPLAEELLAIWADKTQMRHAGILNRRALVEILLLTLGRLPKQQQGALATSSLVMTGTSNHLESSSDLLRAQGMVVAEVMSEFANKSSITLKFDVPGTTGSEAEYFRSLLLIREACKPIKSLKSGQVSLPHEPLDATRMQSTKADVKVEEVADDSDEQTSTGDVQAMRLPDSDDEDSDEDPSLVDRDKVPPPLYIRTLIELLMQHDSYKSIHCGLKHAPQLILRKAQYGTELSNYATNLAEILSGLRDTFDMEEFHQLVLSALFALVAACPEQVGPYLSRAYFVADYSLQQRVIILSALSLGSHLLAEDSSDPAEWTKITESKALQRLSMNGVVLKEKPVAKFKRKATWQNYTLLPLLGNFQAYASHMAGRDDGSFHETILLCHYIKTVMTIYTFSATIANFRTTTSEVVKFVLGLQFNRDEEICTVLTELVARILELNDARTLVRDGEGDTLVALQEWVRGALEVCRHPTTRARLGGTGVKIAEMAQETMDLMLAGQSSTMFSANNRFGMRGLQ